MSASRPEHTGTPTLINLPPPPSDPVTPSDVPGTPTSTTTSMSELSTVAIKDGHRGHLSRHHAQPLDAERADRISRLAGLDRVAQPRPFTPQTFGSTSSVGATAGGTTTNTTPATSQISHPTHGYFDANNQPQIMRERSTVGSASATGSVGGRTTTWASTGSDDTADPERMSEDMEVENSSVGGFSDDATSSSVAAAAANNSLVGFGEGARTPARQVPAVFGQGGKAIPANPPEQSATVGGFVSRQVAQSPLARAAEGARTAEIQDARMIDGVTYDANVVDTAGRTPPPVQEGRRRRDEDAMED